MVSQLSKSLENTVLFYEQKEITTILFEGKKVCDIPPLPFYPLAQLFLKLGARVATCNDASMAEGLKHYSNALVSKDVNDY